MDIEGFEQWYRSEHARLVNSLCMIAGSTDLASEATDEAFARAAARWPRVRAMQSPSAWTYRVALNGVRKSARRRSRELDIAGQTMLPQSFELALAYPEVWEAVRALAPRQRAAIVLRYVADLTEPEIAAVLGITRGTVASTLARARSTLADALDDKPNSTEVPQ